MATREENLKKINAELEMMSDEELEKIAGGSLKVTDESAKKAGLTLKKEDDSPVSWNTGYFRVKKISD